MGRRLELTGQKFGKLQVERLVTTNGRPWCDCLCDCGNRKQVRGSVLVSGRQKTCGRCRNRITPFGDSVAIWLESETQEFVCWIDAADYPLVADYHWHAHRNGRDHGTYWVKSTHRVGLPAIAIHALLMGTTGVDHIDGDGLNNRRSNLRLASLNDQAHNKRLQMNNTTGFKGVFHQRKRFFARIRINSKAIFLGTFNTALEAARAYNEAAKKYHGEFAVLNDVGDHDIILNQKPEVQS
jgi:AP2 domain